MDEQEVGYYWNQNARAWTAIARAGFDTYRDCLNTPAFFEILPDIKGLSGIDVGCGEGYNTRLLAKAGGKMCAIDIAETFIVHAKAIEQDAPLGIQYAVSSATELPFGDASFDFATAFMCLMDMPNPAKALQEIYRILKPDGFLQFSITHPCFNPPHRKNLRDGAGKTYAIEVGDYFKPVNGKIDEWIFGDAPLSLKSQYEKFKIPIFNKTLAEWFDMILHAGFCIEQINEPYPNDTMVSQKPSLQDAQTVAYFLQIRCRKK